jgi:hypothetical protein
MGIAAATPVGRVVKTASTASKMAKTADARRKFDAANERRILNNQTKKSVKVLPRTTAPKTDLSNRGAQLTKAQRAERAQDYQFDKSLGKYYSNQDRIAGTHPSELARGSRGEGVKSTRKTAAIKKEAKPVVKINSAVKSQTADQARSSNAAKKPAPANTPGRTPANPARSTVIVNSAKTVRRLKVGPKKK